LRPGVVQNCFQVVRNSSARRLRIADCARSRIAQPLRFAAVTGAHNYWLWVLRMWRILDTGRI
jgi:hypothetical protein